MGAERGERRGRGMLESGQGEAGKGDGWGREAGTGGRWELGSRETWGAEAGAGGGGEGVEGRQKGEGEAGTRGGQGQPGPVLWGRVLEFVGGSPLPERVWEGAQGGAGCWQRISSCFGRLPGFPRFSPPVTYRAHPNRPHPSLTL